MKYKLIILSALVVAAGCTKLEEKLGSQTTAGSGGGGGVTAANILAGTYDAILSILRYHPSHRLLLARSFHQ